MSTMWTRLLKIAFGIVRHPAIKKPGVKMPTWDGVIAEAEYAPLAAYARQPGAASRK